MNEVAALAVFAVVLAGALAIRARAPLPAHIALARLTRTAAQVAIDATVGRRHTRPRATNSARTATLVDNVLTRRLEQMMVQAAIYSPLANVVLLVIVLLVGGVSCALLFGASIAIALAIGVALFLAPIGYIKLCQLRRVRSFGHQLPEMLDLLKSSLEAGHSLHRGLQVVAEEFSDPVRSETRIILEQTRLGVALPNALEDLLARMPEESLNFLVVAIKIQAEVGSSLAEVIGRLSETIRARHRIRLQIKALTAQPRMSGMIVGLLPFLVLGFFMLIQPDYTMLLFRDPIGIKILKTAIALDLIAFVVIRRVLRTDF